MKPVVLYLFGYFWLAVCCGSATPKLLDSHPPHEWNKLYLVHHWPVTVCKMSENPCKDPPMYWTIHGLWYINLSWFFHRPDKSEECNRTWHFNRSEIQDLLGDMKQYWPDILHPNSTQFWKHEWDKHGTCVATLESLNSQKKYFSKALELYEKLQFNSYLSKLGIKPGTYYQLSTIRDNLTNIYGVTPKIQCISPEKGEEVQTIGQIKICFTKEFNLRNCTESKANSYSAHENTFFRPEELSICTDSLIYYPSEVQLNK
ncbi:ribonuclease T2 isoform X2 [Hemicordylus capensis]|uniref:ribonuclease T2 isoform X2 n=1 Tax=Hemicordylus capensis TaxID=884348 RepID=UPI002304AC9E|nr:ribonuclease T2 isoform X2 [Hemicordylus capensis]XP_053152325.1 ribonuclease T2 isoform X2 [Hemicordylus capensis]XP_053152335.1 ribonuclease T2 isoform X2 [Hemicordylus capensis]XP_053152338.1 ribonuclease T2 isoform X2 [Hemicordylus capensis]XP_053152345.1 ribonuclease T2 isoform X2 [Hemicordylus capensis]XP_053152354.1 ribonuclease T2 isoform X2 [Hemicordylus capensis]